MGTRNLTFVVKDGQFRVAQYCQWDGYPSGQGTTVHNFITNEMTPQFREQIDRTKALTPEEVEARWNEAKGGEEGPLPGFVSMAVADRFKRKNAHLDRDMGAHILSYIQNTPQPEVSLDTNFAADSLFCEWAYLIDLDNDTLEVYRGFNETPLYDSERFKFLEQAAIDRRPNDKYRPIKLLTKFTFQELKDNWSDTKAWANHLEGLAYPDRDKDDA